MGSPTIDDTRAEALINHRPQSSLGGIDRKQRSVGRERLEEKNKYESAKQQANWNWMDIKENGNVGLQPSVARLKESTTFNTQQ
jgi:hypothetical protein